MGHSNFWVSPRRAWPNSEESLRIVNLGVHPSPASFFLQLQKLGSLFVQLLVHLGDSFLLQSLAAGKDFAARNRIRVYRRERGLEPGQPFLKGRHGSLLRQNLSVPLLGGTRVQ